MTIHRINGSKEIVNLLHKEAHCISYNDVRKFNDHWATSSKKLKYTSTHLTLDNNDGKQDINWSWNNILVRENI